MEELKPCPFCGSPAKLVINYDLSFVRCTNNEECAIRTQQYLSEHDAISAWNRRVGDEK